MKPLVVFYSRTGTTTKVANAIAENLKCDIEEIIDTANRKGLFGWLRSGRDGMKKKLTVIQPTKKNPGDYDIVILGTPNWGAMPAPAIRAYIEQNKSKFKNIAFFVTSASGNNEALLKELALICGKQPCQTFGIKQGQVKKGEIAEPVKQFTAKL
jgi:flavodoxin